MPPPDQGHEDARHFVYDDPDFDARSAAARSLRRLGNALVRHRATADELGEIRDLADRLVDDLVERPRSPRPTDYLARRYTDPRPPDGAEVIAFSDRPLSGPANPMGSEVDMRRHGEGVRARVVFGAAFESAPERAHGGAIASMVDDAMGYLMVVIGVAAYTARLEIDYRGGVPVDAPVWFEAHEVERDGRKLHVELTVREGDESGPAPDGDVLIAARGLFVVIPADRLS